MSTLDDLRTILHETAEILQQDEGAAPSDLSGSLKRRTSQLARIFVSGGSGTNTIQALTFSLGTERYAWPVRNVRTIAKISRITPVPSAPTYYRGVVSLRGQVLSVMDIAAYLGLSTAGQASETIIIIDGAGLEIGVLADEVFDVINIPADVVAQASSAGLDPELIVGVSNDGLTILDAENLLQRERRRVENAANG